MARKQTHTVYWKPQPRQLTFLKACGLGFPFEKNNTGPTAPVARIVGYGGAAGGGKSDALLGAAIIAGMTFPGINIGYFRREYPQLEGPGGAIMRSHELMSSWSKWNGGQRRWTFPNDSILQFCHVKDEDDVYSYQSQQFDVILIDEVTQFTRFIVRYLMTRNRATKKGITPFVAMATNPGGIGHFWFKSEFIDCGPPEIPYDIEVAPGVLERHMFIPAKLSDNKILEKRDPGYRATLMGQDEVTSRQLLHGDWDAWGGQFFPKWKRDIHVMEPFEIPDHWKRFRSLDYGMDMTACYWWAVDGQGREYIYRELYKSEMTLRQAAKEILERSPANEKVSYTVASPDLWNRRQDTGLSGEEIMYSVGLTNLVKADNRRIPGWRALREHLEPFVDEQEVVTSNLRVFDNCINLIKYLPLLMHDEHDYEDAADKPHEVTHGPESIRYGVMSRPGKTEEIENVTFRRLPQDVVDDYYNAPKAERPNLLKRWGLLKGEGVC